MSSFEHKVESSSSPLPIPGSLEAPNYPIGPPRESLLQFKEPELASADPSSHAHSMSLSASLGKSQTLGGSASKGSKSSKISQLTEILNSILPPRLYLDPSTGSLLRQCASPHPSSREEVLHLQSKLDELLQERQARENGNGICPIREELYSQCFDELIRQVTIESPERGLLLLRVRDEVRMSIAAYQTLYQSSITFGMRKTLQAESGLKELQIRLEELESEKLASQLKVQDHRALYESVEKRIAEQRSQEEKKMAEEKEFLKFQAQHLESFLKSAGSN